MHHTVACLKKFKCNKLAAKVFIEKVDSLITLFGTQNTGLISLSRIYKVSFPDHLVYALENSLSEFLSMCHSFAGHGHNHNFAYHLMYNSEAGRRFAHFNLEIEDVVRRLGLHFGNVASSLFKEVAAVLAKDPPYFVAGLLMPVAGEMEDLAQKKSKAKKSARHIVAVDETTPADVSTKHRSQAHENVCELLSQRGVEVSDKLATEVLHEVHLVRRASAKLLAAATEDVVNQPYFVIKQVALRDFWVSQIHPKLSVTPKTFGTTVQTYLSAKGANYMEAIELAKVFRKALKPYLESADGNVDAFALAGVARRLRINTEVDFEAVVRKMQTISGQVIFPEMNFHHEVRL
jgi:hypothetical protein